MPDIEIATDYTAFIFARGGSKGVVDKNIRTVAGKPLIAHSIDTALDSDFINRVVVSTDSDRIALVAEQLGAEILIRPAELAQDSSPELLSWQHAINCYRDHLESHKTFISIPATSPLRSVNDINAGIMNFRQNHCDLLFGICEGHRNPYLNMVTINDRGLLDIVNSGSDAFRRQDVPDVYDVTTCIYVGDIEYLLTCEKLMQGRVGFVQIQVERSLDIDTEYDLYLADLILSNPFS